MSLINNANVNRPASPPVTDVPILSRMLTASTATARHDPTHVHHGFVVNGFVRPQPAHLRPIIDAVAPRMLAHLRRHVTRFSAGELCHCVLTDCRPFEPQTVETVSMWDKVGLAPTVDHDNIFRSLAVPDQFIAFYTNTDGTIDAVLSGNDLDNIYHNVCEMSHLNAISQEAWAITYPTGVL